VKQPDRIKKNIPVAGSNEPSATSTLRSRRNKQSGRRAGGITRTVNAGFAHHQAGRLDRAAALYRKALQREPEHAEALHLLGLIAFQRGEFDSAIELIGRALTSQTLSPPHRATADEGRARDVLRQGRQEPDHEAGTWSTKFLHGFPDRRQYRGSEQLKLTAISLSWGMVVRAWCGRRVNRLTCRQGPTRGINHT
jgi:tetratricopeptide (TPR) repeat protein